MESKELKVKNIVELEFNWRNLDSELAQVNKHVNAMRPLYYAGEISSKTFDEAEEKQSLMAMEVTNLKIALRNAELEFYKTYHEPAISY